MPTERIASEPEHRKIEHSTQSVSSEIEKTTLSENKKRLRAETTSTMCKFIC